LRYLSQLCRIDYSEEEEEALLHSLQKIVHHVSQLSEVNTQQVVPCNHVIENMVCPLHKDEIESAEVLDREEFTKNSPEHMGGLIRVPEVINP
jgi:aspartyl-tRNA(Asn)/glutamyl-tRNA(Gln) amidotransferase subunit C